MEQSLSSSSREGGPSHEAAGPSPPDSRAAQLGQIAEFLRREAHVLVRFPELLFQQASNWPDRTAPCNAARTPRPGATLRPWIRWRNKPQHLDPCRLTLLARPGAGCEVARSTGHLLYAEGAVVRIKDLSGTRAEVVLEGHTAEVTACAFSPDGREVVSACRDGSLRYWDAATGALQHTLVAFKDVTACAFCPDGTLVAVGYKSGHLAFFENHGGIAEIKPCAHPASITVCHWSPDGRRLVTASGDGTLHLWAGVDSAPIVLQSGPVSSCAFSPDASRFVTAGIDSLLRIWDAATGAQLDERIVRAGAPNSPHTPGGEGGVASCAYSPDGTKLALGCWDCFLRIWDAETLTELQTLAGHGEPVVACTFTLDGNAVVSRDLSGAIKVFDLQDDVSPREPHTGMVSGLMSSRDGRWLASESWDNTWKVWDIVQARCVATVPRRSPSDPPPEGHGPWAFPGGAGRQAGRHKCEVLSPVGTRKAVIAPVGRSLELSEAGTDARIALLEARPAGAPLLGLTSLLGVTACSFSSNGEYLAAVSDDKTIKTWGAEDGSLHCRFPTVGIGTVVAFTGPRDFVCGDATGTIYFLRIEDGAAVRARSYSAGKTSSARR